jgi:mitochondrial fission protein ELM1
MAQASSTRKSVIRPFDCWVVSDGRPGNENQAFGLAEAAARLIPLKIALKRFRVKAPWRSLPREVWGDPFARLSPAAALLRPPFPDLWIACGRLSTPFTLAVKKRNPATFTVQVQRPRAPLDAFDLVVPPEHDAVAGDNVVATVGSPNRATAERLAAEASQLAASMASLPSPRVAVLIGGASRAYGMSAARVRGLAERLGALAASGAGLMITASRRTPRKAVEEISAALAGLPHFLWDGAPVAGLANPYFGMLGLADHILVTEDSVNMTAESAATGKPVHILPLDRLPTAFGKTKFDRFHEALRARGATRVFDGRLETWTYAPLDETSRAAAEIVASFEAARTA